MRTGGKRQQCECGLSSPDDDLDRRPGRSVGCNLRVMPEGEPPFEARVVRTTRSEHLPYKGHPFRPVRPGGSRQGGRSITRLTLGRRWKAWPVPARLHRSAGTGEQAGTFPQGRRGGCGPRRRRRSATRAAGTSHRQPTRGRRFARAKERGDQARGRAPEGGVQQARRWCGPTRHTRPARNAREAWRIFTIVGAWTDGVCHREGEDPGRGEGPPSKAGAREAFR